MESLPCALQKIVLGYKKELEKCEEELLTDIRELWKYAVMASTIFRLTHSTSRLLAAKWLCRYVGDLAGDMIVQGGITLTFEHDNECYDIVMLVKEALLDFSEAQKQHYHESLEVLTFDRVSPVMNLNCNWYVLLCHRMLPRRQPEPTRPLLEVVEEYVAKWISFYE
jgi:hypothetical protein